DLAGHAPGTVRGPPDVRALPPGTVQPGECDDGLRRSGVEEIVPVRQVHPRPFAHRAWHRVPPRLLDDLGRLPRLGQSGERTGRAPAETVPHAEPAVLRRGCPVPANRGEDFGVRQVEATLLRPLAAV